MLCDLPHSSVSVQPAQLKAVCGIDLPELSTERAGKHLSSIRNGDVVLKAPRRSPIIAALRGAPPPTPSPASAGGGQGVPARLCQCRPNPRRTMSEFAVILLSTILVNNYVLVQFLGLCPFMGVSNKLETAVGMAGATTFVLTLASICSYLVNTYLLEPFGIEYLRTISFILVIAVVVQFARMFIEKTSPLMYRVLGVFLPLITTNCAVLGVALQNTIKAHTFVQSTLYGFGAAVGFSLVLILFSSMRERLAAADVPLPFKGAAIGMVTAGLMSLAFMGFSGLV